MKLARKIRIRGLLGISLSWFLLFGMPLTGFAAEVSNAVEQACRGVVRVFTVERGAMGELLATGSGFGVGKAGEETDIFVTNWHVVTAEEGDTVDDVYILLSNDAVQKENNWYEMDESKMVKCEVLYTTTGYPDIAILKAERPIEGHVALPLMHAKDAQRGSSIYAIGFPATSDNGNGMNYLYAGIDDANISTGVLSKFFQFELGGSTWAIQHDAHINNGNSGGPLVTEDGAVIGINTYGFGENAQEYSVSIFADYAMQALDGLGIPYDVYGQGSSFGAGRLLGLAAAVVALLVLAAVVRARKKAKSSSGGDDWVVQGVSGALAGSKLLVEGKIRIGRSAEGNSLIYPSDASGISRYHCEVMQEKGRAYIRDVGSSYGTYLEGKKLPEHQWIEVQPGNRFYLASERDCFQIVKTAVGGKKRREKGEKNG